MSGTSDLAAPQDLPQVVLAVHSVSLGATLDQKIWSQYDKSKRTMPNELIAQLRSGLDNADGGEMGGVVLTMNLAADKIAELQAERDQLADLYANECDAAFYLEEEIMNLEAMVEMLSQQNKELLQNWRRSNE